MIGKEASGGVKWTTLSSLVVIICSLVSMAVLARFVPKADFGLIAIVVFTLSFFELFNDMGISVGILHKQNMIQEEYSSLYWFNIFLSIVLFGIVIALTPLISSFYNFPQLNKLIPLVGLNLLINGIGRQFKNIQQKELRFKQISLVEISTAIVALICSIVLAIKGFGVYALVANTLITAFLSNILFLIISLSHGHKITLYYKFKNVQPFLKMGLYQMGGQIANYFNRDFDILIVGKTMSPEVLGLYSLAKQLVFRPYQLLNPIIIKVATPLLAKLQNSQQELKDSYLKVVNIIGSLNIIVYAILFLFAPIAINILYGPNYLEADWIVRILCVYMIARSTSNPVGSLTVATGKTHLEFFWNLIMLLIMPIAIYLGSLGGLNSLAITLSIIMLFLIFPFWKFIINNMIKVSFLEYLKSCFSVNIKELMNLIR
ncbi:MOP flippase family protein [Sphingobacterium mizutaii]|uniref:MOP flippase family protein n=1 Tax=Sphingobacterium mizutaii TaxID=1010 RepID=UPI0016299146|nr:MOP flippase family protein [Sphingobacterium mizutaii]